MYYCRFWGELQGALCHLANWFSQRIALPTMVTTLPVAATAVPVITRTGGTKTKPTTKRIRKAFFMGESL